MELHGTVECFAVFFNAEKLHDFPCVQVTFLCSQVEMLASCVWTTELDDAFWERDDHFQAEKKADAMAEWDKLEKKKKEEEKEKEDEEN